MPTVRVKRHDGCGGRLERVYVRAPRPTRGYVPVGWSCDTCGELIAEHERVDDQEDELDAEEHLTWERRIWRLPMAVPKSRRPTRGRK